MTNTQHGRWASTSPAFANFPRQAGKSFIRKIGFLQPYFQQKRTSAMKFYTLDQDNKVKEATMDEFMAYMEKEGGAPRIKYSDVNGIEISTVFMGIDSSLGGEREPQVFETMTFGGPADRTRIRASTYEEAVANHDVAERGIAGDRL